MIRKLEAVAAATGGIQILYAYEVLNVSDTYYTYNFLTKETNDPSTILQDLTQYIKSLTLKV